MSLSWLMDTSFKIWLLILLSQDLCIIVTRFVCIFSKKKKSVSYLDNPSEFLKVNEMHD